MEAYEAASGTIEADLFPMVDRGGLRNDSGLLSRLACERLFAAVGRVKAEGWQWVECMLSCDWQDLQSYERAYPKARPLSVETLAQIERLEGEAEDFISEGE